MAKQITEDGEIIDVVTREPIGIAPPLWKTPWNHNTDAESLATALCCEDASKTQQQFAKEADINNILRKFLSTGELNVTGNPIYRDIEAEFDLQDQMVTGHQVEEAWLALPAAVRNILKDPKTFADYVTHCLETGDLEPLRELGLAKPEASGEAIVTPTPSGGAPAPEPGKEAPREPQKAP